MARRAGPVRRSASPKAITRCHTPFEREDQDDRQLFTSLERIGITNREVTGIVSAQMGLIFFLPFSMGAVHTVFALRALGSLVAVDVIGYALLVVGLYALVQGVFFLLTRSTYLRALRPAV